MDNAQHKKTHFGPNIWNQGNLGSYVNLDICTLNKCIMWKLRNIFQTFENALKTLHVKIWYVTIMNIKYINAECIYAIHLCWLHIMFFVVKGFQNTFTY